MIARVIRQVAQTLKSGDIGPDKRTCAFVFCTCGRVSHQYWRGHGVVPIDLRALTLLEQQSPTFQCGLLWVTIALLDEIRVAAKSESSSHNQAHVAKSISSTHPITY